MARPTPILGLLALAGLVVAPPAPSGSVGPGTDRFTGQVEASAVALSPIQGTLRLRAALRLTGGTAIGGLSALHVEEGAGGLNLIMVSDTGALVRVRGLSGVGRAPGVWRPLPPSPRDGGGKADRDSESLARVGDDWWVGFERRNELRRYSADFLRLTGRYRSDALAQLPDSSGLEALAALPDRRLIGIAEQQRGDGRSPVFLWRVDAAGRIASQRTLWARLPDGLRATDVAWLDGQGGGRLLVLARGFRVPTGFHTALLIVPLTPKPGFGGQELSGQVLARFGPDWDNLEGLSITRANGRTTAWLISDNNFSVLQRTLLVGLWLD